ncbi:MAG: branched-chain amino acid ABC transporter permease, partial [Burkholderiales bacterium]
FVVVLTFLGFGISAVIDRATLAAFLAGGVVALFVWNWPLRLGLIVATVAGVAVGLLLERTGRPSATAKT